MVSLYQFLSARRVEKGGDYTHTSLGRSCGAPAGAFRVLAADRDMFYRLYREAMAGGVDLHLTEKYRRIGPFVVDLDFRFEPTSEELTLLGAGKCAKSKGDVMPLPQPPRRHSRTHAMGVALLYAREIAAHLEAKQPFDIYVMEKPTGPSICCKGSGAAVLKDGMHLVIPDMVTSAPVRHMVREAVLVHLGEALLGLRLINTLDDVLDSAVVERNGWLMFGSRKPSSTSTGMTGMTGMTAVTSPAVAASAVPTAGQACPPSSAYEVVCVLRYHVDTGRLETLDTQMEPDCLVERLSLCNKYEEVPSRPWVLEHVEASRCAEADRVARRAAVCASAKACPLPDGRANVVRLGVSLPAIEAMVEVLSVRRADVYREWIGVGMCLRNIDHRLCPSWVAFSMRSDKYIAGECERLWDCMGVRPDGMHIGTLHVWARADSPDAYRGLRAQGCDKLLGDTVEGGRTGTNHDIARVVHDMFAQDFVCSCISRGSWYEFRDHRWHESDSGVGLRRHLSEAVSAAFASKAVEARQRMLSLDADDPDRLRHCDVADRLDDVSCALKNTKFKNDVMRECSDLFYSPNFDDRLDAYTWLLGFNNGVFDLLRHEFREGRPDDFVSLSTGVDYIAFDESAPCVREIRAFWSKVMVDPEMCEYMLLTLGGMLNGKKAEERFHIWTGGGCHARDTAVLLRNGASCAVQDVAVGQVLMGDDGRSPRVVMRLCGGYADMYRVSPLPCHVGDSADPSFDVNGEHVLSLRVSDDTPDSGCLVTTVGGGCRVSWLQQTQSGQVRWCERLFDTPEEAMPFVDTEVFRVSQRLHDGAWVVSGGAGIPGIPAICSSEAEVRALLVDMTVPVPLRPGDVVDMTVHAYMECIGSVGQGHLQLHRPVGVEFENEGEADADDMRPSPWDLGCWLGEPGNTRLPMAVQGCHDMRIPQSYLMASWSLRYQLFASLVVAQGGAHTLRFREESLCRDVVRLARSLGVEVSRRHSDGGVRLWMLGLDELSASRGQSIGMSFTCQRIADAEFFGFELGDDTNHRYLTADLVVHHNSNGKSMAVNLLESALGAYCCKFPITLMTGKRAASNSASSEVARARGRRFAVLQEPGEAETLNVGILKELTGADTILSREIYKPPIEFRPQWSMVLCCNHLPAVPSNDNGTWRRLLVSAFESRFCKHPRLENEFPIDTDLSSRFEVWKTYYASMLIEYHRRGAAMPHGVPIPAAVTRATDEYQRNSDLFADFVASCLVHTPASPDAFLTLDEAFNALKEWVQRDNIPLRVPKKRSVKDELAKVLGRHSATRAGEDGWCGWSLCASVSTVVGDNFV